MAWRSILKMMCFIKRTLTVTLLTLGMGATVLACTCELRPPACYEYSRTSRIFLGTVASVSTTENSPFEEVEMKVLESFVGETPEKTFTYNYGHSCAHTFKLGETYLIYGSGVGEDGRKNEFSTSLCTRTAKESDAQTDLQFLRAVKRGESLFWISGTISKTGYYLAQSGIRAEVLGSRPKVEGVSDESGYVGLDVRKSGRYRVRVHLPKGRGDINSMIRDDVELWEENRKKIVGGRFAGERPYVDFQVDVKANRCSWFDVSIPSHQSR